MRLKDLTKKEEARVSLASVSGITASAVEKADYDWLELYGCKLELVRRINGGGLTFLDADEVRNRVVIGVADNSAVADMRGRVIGAGLPVEIFLIEVIPPPPTAQY